MWHEQIYESDIVPVVGDVIMITPTTAVKAETRILGTNCNNVVMLCRSIHMSEDGLYTF